MAADQVDGEHHVALGMYLEVLDEQAHVVHAHVVDVFGEHAQAQVLQLRQHVRQRDVDAAAVDLETQLVGLVRGAVEGHAHGLVVLQLRQRLHVGGGDVRRYLLDVAGRQSRAVAAGQRQPSVSPSAWTRLSRRSSCQLRTMPISSLLQHGGVETRRLARFRAHHHVQARQRGLAHQHAGVDRLAAQLLAQHALDPVANGRVETLARNVGQAGEEAAVLVATHEQAWPGALLELEHATGDVEQLVRRALEQLVARQGLQDVAQCLARIGIAAQTGAAHHRLVLQAHQRNFLRAARVGGGREQAQETLLGHRTAVGVEAQHADVVHVAGTAHPRARIGLGQDDRVHGARMRQPRGLKGLQRTRRGGPAVIAQDAQPRARDRAQHRIALDVGNLVFAIAQEGEVVLGHPAQEGLGLGHALLVQRKRTLRQLLGDLHHVRAHGPPVADRRAHVGQRRLEVVQQVIAVLAIGQAVDLQVHH